MSLAVKSACHSGFQAHDFCWIACGSQPVGQFSQLGGGELASARQLKGKLNDFGLLAWRQMLDLVNYFGCGHQRILLDRRLAGKGVAREIAFPDLPPSLPAGKQS